MASCCFAGCSAEDIVSRIGLGMNSLFAHGGGDQSTLSAASGPPPVPDDPRANGSSKRTNRHVQTEQSCALEDYADAKALPQEFLRNLGVKDVTHFSRPALRIPYPDEEGREAAVRFRVSLNGADKFRWRRNDKPLPYGLRLLEEARNAGYVVLVEGESDCHTLWYHEIPALGIPGASNWRNEWSVYLEGIETIFAIIEPDQGGGVFQEKLSSCEAVRDRLHFVDLGDQKDPSSLHIADSEGFVERFNGALDSARSCTELERAKAEAASREAWERCRGLAKEPDILGRFGDELVHAGVAGEARLGKLLYLIVTSRLLDKPVSVAVKGPSSGGKSYTVEQVLRFFPASAYYALTAMSEHALAYSNEPLVHRMLVIYEAAGMNSDFQTYLVRSLLSEGSVRYETVEKTSEGLKARLIEREGPTGLIVTTTAVRLHPENETRLLSLRVTDTQEQTRNVLMALAAEKEGTGPDLETWRALQEWLETARHHVTVPYARTLAELVPPVGVRLRRDFGAVLNLIRAHALLHQASREYDAAGRIVAEIEDYAAVREMVEDLVAEGIEATVPSSVRETVEALRRLVDDKGDDPISLEPVAKELALDKSAASRRMREAITRGYARNLEDRKGRPGRYVPGDPMPEDLEILPSPEKVLQRCGADGEGNNHPLPPDRSDNLSELRGMHNTPDRGATLQRSGEERERFIV
jgi:hypothetical protein